MNRDILKRIIARRHAALCNFSRRYTKTFSRKGNMNAGMPVNFADFYVEDLEKKDKDVKNLVDRIQIARMNKINPRTGESYFKGEYTPESGIAMDDVFDSFGDPAKASEIFRRLTKNDHEYVTDKFMKIFGDLPGPLANAYANSFRPGDKIDQPVDPRMIDSGRFGKKLSYQNELKTYPKEMQDLLILDANIKETDDPRGLWGEGPIFNSLVKAHNDQRIPPTQFKDAIRKLSVGNKKIRDNYRKTNTTPDPEGTVDLDPEAFEKDGTLKSSPNYFGTAPAKFIAATRPDLSGTQNQVDPSIAYGNMPPEMKKFIRDHAAHTFTQMYKGK